ncbi:hypothetical protein GMRT_11011 [Giardia muris]|uniref:Uncharacterized protein n=1 Tax=Giardia muris TaxID=5742 RepID=A0A4Z1STQ0_GIAMU|nr:hypothetical protein GMRT_11011 [Giardia muris]|eukprot:TNJ29302.1 hypothetical protein GMRT_11011 [Giardia muris]
MWPCFASYEERHDFQVRRVVTGRGICYRVDFEAPAPIPGKISFLNACIPAITIWLEEEGGGESVQASGKIELMTNPHVLSDGGTNAFTVYREALLPRFACAAGEPILIVALELRCAQASPVWVRAGLEQIAIFHRICHRPRLLGPPQPPQLLLQDGSNENEGLAGRAYHLLNVIAGLSYYVAQART